ncbi:MAG: recombination regulator RecX [Dehalococcoidales bacterium]|nr:recombination regulator RecX [Dehalococcoidales bacterium]
MEVLVDGRPAWKLPVAAVVREGVKEGQELTEERASRLAVLERYEQCLRRALHLLSYRPRSEAEVRERLLRHGFDGDTVTSVLGRLREEGLLDDLTFARFWKENREVFRPCGRRKTALELRRKGISDEIIKEVTADIDEDANAYNAALSRAKKLPLDDYQLFRRRLGGYLARRGFGYGVIDGVVARLWKELTGHGTDNN